MMMGGLNAVVPGVVMGGLPGHGTRYAVMGDSKRRPDWMGAEDAPEGIKMPA